MLPVIIEKQRMGAPFPFNITFSSIFTIGSIEKAAVRGRIFDGNNGGSET
jgi:hypothetical protein